jgi:nucleotide-binding universal stress UspA family protein
MRRPGPDDGVGDRAALHAALFRTDRPVLLAPPEPVSGFGRRVAIAWRDDKRAIRALITVMRWLPRAERVEVLAGFREGTPPPVLPAILAEHGIAATLHALPIGPGIFGAALLDKAHELGADLLVAGAYAHSPLRELVLGGVTRHLLAHAEMPLLVRH